jgi:hypothetical protein
MKQKTSTRSPRAGRFTILAVSLCAMVAAGSAQAATVIYEGFDYDVGTNAGNGGTTEEGLTGTWTDSGNNTTSVISGSLAWGGLATSGNSLDTPGGQNHFMGARSISATALSGSDLLDDGETLWFSVIMGYDSGGNRTNSRLAFALSTQGFATSNFDYNFTTTGATGIGVTVGRFDGANGKIVATQFRDQTFGNSGFAGNVFGNTGSAILPAANTNIDYALVVGRITWGATALDNDVIDIFLPGTNLALPTTVHSTLSVVVDQSGYDTITMARGDAMVMDEIRFGSDYASVVPVPEPSTALLGGLGMLALLRRRRA